MIKRMGVMNVTPNSFSDGGDLTTAEQFKKKLAEFNECDAVDVGAESTAPANESISWENEWERLEPYLHLLKDFPGALSFDTYHEETVEELLKFYQRHGFTQDFIWNDVSGKWSPFVEDFLSISPKFHYVYCHNLAPNRGLTGKHMDYVNPGLKLEDLIHYFVQHRHPRVIFDPCLGFSKTYEQNWEILEKFGELQEKVRHSHWLLGFSRKSFLRKRFGLTLEQRGELDQAHDRILKELMPAVRKELWIRAHRF